MLRVKLLIALLAFDYDMVFRSLTDRYNNAMCFKIDVPAFWNVYTAISRKVVGHNVHTTNPKGNMGYDQYTFPDTVAIEFEPTFVAFFWHHVTNIRP